MKNLKIYWSCLAFTVLLSGFAMASDGENHDLPEWNEDHVSLAATAAKIAGLEMNANDVVLAESADSKTINKLKKLLNWYEEVVTLQSEILKNSEKDCYRWVVAVYGPIVAWQIVTFDVIDLILFGAPAAYGAYQALDKANQDKYAALLRQEIKNLNVESLLEAVNGSEPKFENVVKLACAAYAKAHSLTIPKECNASSLKEEAFDRWQEKPWYMRVLPWETATRWYQWALTKKANKSHKK